MIHIEHVNKIYKTGDVETAALKDIELTIQDGAFVVILGPSGSGKSTLLNVISGLDSVTSGTITFGDTVLTELSRNR
ncbi:ATP-binding cassette domain-containing protein [Exiguobacterium mexicanum]|uniref:ATP-binding cassette domain-containing protein n=1 Tax=Exiguobacterium mexicanum TaxID=340146 RepID=UPI0037BEE278